MDRETSYQPVKSMRNIEPDSVQVFHGALSPLEAQVYVRIPNLPGGERWSLKGTLRGPECKFGRTLPATATLRDLGSGATLLGRITVGEPCYWSSDTPALYKLGVEVAEDGVTILSINSSIGFRFLGTDGPHLRFDNRRWVLRGTSAAMIGGDIPSWREARLAVLVDAPSNQYCEHAAREGLIVVARLAGPESQLLAQLRSVSRSPAVASAILPRHSIGERDLRDTANNLLLGQQFQAAEPVHVATWADLAFCEIEQSSMPRQESGDPIPLIAMRKSEAGVAPGDASAVRAQCDQLQHDLAPLGDLAGYVIV